MLAMLVLCCCKSLSGQHFLRMTLEGPLRLGSGTFWRVDWPHVDSERERYRLDGTQLSAAGARCGPRITATRVTVGAAIQLSMLRRTLPRRQDRTIRLKRCRSVVKITDISRTCLPFTCSTATSLAQFDRTGSSASRPPGLESEAPRSSNRSNCQIATAR